MEIAELQEKLEKTKNLLQHKEVLLAQLDTVNKEITLLLSQLKDSGGTRKSLSHSLNYYIIRAMAPGAQMSPQQIADKVVELGYETTNEKFAGYIQAALKKRKDVSKVRHGIYVRKASLKQTSTKEL